MPKYAAPKKAETCAKEIFLWLKQHDLWEGCVLYVNGMRYCSYKPGADAKKVYEWKDEFDEIQRVWAQPADPWNYLEYCNRHAHFISLTFDGGLFYDVINFNLDSESGMKYCQAREEEFHKILEKYGYYYECGNSWNCSAYKA